MGDQELLLHLIVADDAAKKMYIRCVSSDKLMGQQILKNIRTPKIHVQIG